jgi:hypothetical protein
MAAGDLNRRSNDRRGQQLQFETALATGIGSQAPVADQENTHPKIVADGHRRLADMERGRASAEKNRRFEEEMKTAPFVRRIWLQLKDSVRRAPWLNNVPPTKNLHLVTGAILFGSLLAVSLAGEPAPTIPAGLRANYPTIFRRIQVGPDERVFWEGRPVTLVEYIDDLRSFHEQHPEAAAGVLIEPLRTKGSAVAWVFEEARKAGIKSAWFGPSAVAPSFDLPTNTGKSTTSLAGLESASPLSWVSAGQWKNAGKRTPKAAAETILWASANGDGDALASAVDFDEFLAELRKPMGIQLSGTKPREITSSERLKILQTARERLNMAAVQFYDMGVHPRYSTIYTLGVDAAGWPHFIAFDLGPRNDEWYLGSDSLYMIIYGAAPPVSE